MARQGKMSPFSKMEKKAYEESNTEKEFKDCIFSVEVEVLRKVSQFDYKLNLIKEQDKFTLTGNSHTIHNMLFNTSIIEHPQALTSRIKTEVYGEPIYTILSCEVVED